MAMVNSAEESEGSDEPSEGSGDVVLEHYRAAVLELTRQVSTFCRTGFAKSSHTMDFVQNLVLRQRLSAAEERIAEYETGNAPLS